MRFKSLLILFVLVCGGEIEAQLISADSIVSIVAARITQQEKTIYSREAIPKSDYLYSFYIEDISSRKPILEQGYGIYEFGLYGDDIDRWIMLYDETGYKIFEKFLNVEMLGEILDYFERNQFSDSKSFKYIKGLYLSSVRRECFGEKEITE